MRLTKKRRATIVDEYLQIYEPNPEVPLTFSTPFQALVAVLLSAQCTDKRVNEVTPYLFGPAPDPQSMCKLGQEAIEKIIRPCGLAPKKSKAIAELSAILIEKHSSKVPRTREALTALPGIGRKSANVILSQVYGEPAFAVDTHILRCAKRWGLSTSKSPDAVEKDLCALFPNEDWNRIHLQIILYARRFCPARGHVVEACPICSRLTRHAQVTTTC
jgi:endonuclease-3